MKPPVLFGLLLIVLGALMALVPQFVFPLCETTLETAFGGVLPMRCHWTGQAEIGVGFLQYLAGIIQIGGGQAVET